MWRCVLPVKPFGKQRPRMGKFGVYTPKATKDVEAEIRWYLKAAKPKPEKLTGPVSVHIVCTFEKPASAPKSRIWPTVKPDIDNLAKTVLDAANGILWNDDAQVIGCNTIKRYGPESSIEIAICEPLSEEDEDDT